MLNGLFTKFLVTLHLKWQFPIHSDTLGNVEDIVVFLGLKVLNSDICLCFPTVEIWSKCASHFCGEKTIENNKFSK